jgi:hypothetical protein
MALANLDGEYATIKSTRSVLDEAAAALDQDVRNY